MSESRMSAGERQYYDNPSLWSPGTYETGAEAQRIQVTLQWIPPRVQTVLDVGCGNGDLTNRIEDRFVVGLDSSLSALQWVRVPHMQGDIANLPFADSSFDLIISAEVIEHLRSAAFQRALAELRRVARRYILISVPYQEILEGRSAVCPMCSCRFHRYFHMRSFGRRDIEDLFHEWHDVQLVEAEGIVQQKQRRFLRALVFLRDALFRHAAPFPDNALCPQCGYSRPTHLASVQPMAPATGTTPLFTRWAKRVWPERRVYWWWLALYAKGEG